MTNCVWGLLSIKELEFIHVSSCLVLKGRSLFHFIHPDEVLLAERDLFKFISRNEFGGSITRCRMRNYTSNHRSNNNLWLIVDIIMYIATKDLLLCFLHQQDSHCTIMNEESILDLKEYLQQKEQEKEERQFFHIVDNQTRSVLLTWPNHYSYDDTQIDTLDYPSMSPRNSCFHCVQRSPRLNTIGQKIDTLFIDYGPFIFILGNIIPPIPSKRKKHQPSFLPFNEINKQQSNRIRCQSCGTSSSPEWRRGPTGHKTLCNACGLRYSRSVARQGRMTKIKQHSLFQPTE